MPAATETAAKPERERLLWQSLKQYIMLDRQKKREELEAEVEVERLRKEREARDRQDAMTLGETREQIQLAKNTLEDLKNEKQQLFLQLKKVLNADEIRKKQQQKKESEMFALHNCLLQQAIPQSFLPPRASHQPTIQKYLQGTPPMGHSHSHSMQPGKRACSPSPTPPGFYKSSNSSYISGPKMDDNRRVLWNKQAYQNPAGTLYYPAPNQQDTRVQSIIFPTYSSNLPMPIRQNYHIDLTATNQQPSQHVKHDTKSQPAQVYHINIDQTTHPSALQTVQSQQPNSTHSHSQNHVTMEKIVSDRVYHIDDRKERIMSAQQQQQQSQHLPHQALQSHQTHQLHQPQHPSQSQQPIGHITDGIIYAPIRTIPASSMMKNIMTITPNQQQQIVKSGGIGQAYLSRTPQQSSPGQQSQIPQIHYQRHRF